MESVPYLLRSAAHPGGSGWQIRTRRWLGGHVAPSGPTWLQTCQTPRSEVHRDPTSCLESQSSVRGRGGVYTTQNSVEPPGGAGSGALSASQECVTRAAWTPAPSLAHPSAVAGDSRGQLGVLAGKRARDRWLALEALERPR